MLGLQADGSFPRTSCVAARTAYGAAFCVVTRSLRETPRHERSSDYVDITDQVAQVIELDRGVDTAVEAGVDAW